MLVSQPYMEHLNTPVKTDSEPPENDGFQVYNLIFSMASTKNKGLFRGFLATIVP